MGGSDKFHFTRGYRRVGRAASSRLDEALFRQGGRAVGLVGEERDQGSGPCRRGSRQWRLRPGRGSSRRRPQSRPGGPSSALLRSMAWGPWGVRSTFSGCSPPAAPGQRPLVVRGFGDAARPPRRRQWCQLPLTHRPRLGGVLQAVPATDLEVLRGQRPQLRPHQTQHLLIARRQLLQACPDSHTTGAGRDERLRHTPQSTQPVTPRRHPTDPAARGNEHHPGRSRIRRKNVSSLPESDPTAGIRDTTRTTHTHSRSPEHP